MYDSHLKYSGTDPEFKKKPPNNRNGMIIGGPTDRAIDVEELAHEIRYPVHEKKIFETKANILQIILPADVETLATKVTKAIAMKNDIQVGRSPIIG